MTQRLRQRPILVIDNRDSFVFNLARYLSRLAVDAEIEVVPAHDTSLEQVAAIAPQAVVISPGPCTPAEAGISLEVVQWASGRVPLLGVCLGHQAIAAACGGRVVRCETPLHGRTSPVHHNGTGIFAGLPSPFAACRYHSLVVDEASLPRQLAVTARDPAGTVMAIADDAAGLYGVQFHPEAILSEHGYPLLANFLAIAEITSHDPGPLAGGEWRRPVMAPEPTGVVTF